LAPVLRRTGDSDIKEIATRNTPVAIERSSLSARERCPMNFYVGVFQPLETGGWRALFPDIPFCHVVESSLDLAIFRAANALTELRQNSRALIPAPRDLMDIKRSWAAASNVDWRSCVITMIPMRG